MLPVVAALALAVAPPPAVQLARLADLYRAYDLPLPPKDAKLYRWSRPGWAPHSGFGVRPNADGWPDALLVGCSERSAYFKETVEIPLDPKVINPGEVSLLTALQLQVLGRHELAEAVFVPTGRQGENAVLTLAETAWGYWADRLFDPTVDRAVIARRLAVVLNGQTKAFGIERRVWQDPFVRREFYDALLLSLKPTGAKPGSVEAAIDELIDVGGGSCRTDPRYVAVVARGFDAVPALIAHLSDARPTRFVEVWGHGFGPGRHYQLKHMASDILRGLMDDDGWEAETDKNGVLRAKDVKAWWVKTAKLDEEAYAVQRVLTREDDAMNPNSHLLQLIQHKYPHRLPEVFYVHLADRPEMWLNELAWTVSGSSLPKEKKRELFVAAAESKREDWRRDGRHFLRGVDPDEYRRRMLAAIAALPATPGAESYTCPACKFAAEMLTCDDPQVWAAAEKYLKGADVSIRAEWLQTMGYADQPSNRPERVALLAAFLSDNFVRDENAMSKFFPSHRDFSKMEVRNVAALSLGHLLDLKAKPTPKWTADEWKAFRERVAAAVK